MRTVMFALFVLLPILSFADDWTPPENPDPHAILWEAKTDAQAGRHEVALAKQLWYHENALALQPAQSAVRLSFALSNWLELGESYPPALKKMKQVRDDVEKRVRDEDQVRVKFVDFHEFVAFNRTLREEQRTVETYKWLDETNAEDAKRVFHVAKPALIKQKEYELCGKYIVADRDLKRIGENYERGLKLAKDKFGERHREFTEKQFLNASTTLVALLVQNDQKTEAEEAAMTAKKFVKNADLQKKLDRQLELALEGTVPTPWP
ncbi:MAG: hypothetical protein H8E66_12835 [Planctomycetes bacterium]|nr:hypothetical protein [Planctomycetota bacterium]